MRVERRLSDGYRTRPAPIRVGVIGAGKMGAHHARSYASLGGLCALHGVYDVDAARAAVLAERHETRAYATHEQLLEQVDAVTIASPSSLHVEHALVALDADVHVLIEKPVALDPIDAGRITVAAEAHPDRIVQVGHIEHFNPAVGELRKLLAEQRMIAIDVQRLSPFDPRVSDADVVQDLMLHDIHVVLSLVPSPLRHVQSAALAVHTGRSDYAAAQLVFADGMIATLAASRVTEEKIRRLNVTTAEAHVRVDYLTRSIEVCRSTRLLVDASDQRAYRQESMVERIFVPHEEPLVAELRAFLECVRTGAPPAVDLAMGIRCLEVVDAIRSAALSAAVQLAA
jgi:virulence factor